MTDPIADMLTRIRNAQMARKQDVLIPYSALKFSIAKILETEKFIAGVDKVPFNMSRRKGKQAQFQIKINLLYHDGKPVINTIRRISKPGMRVYRRYQELPRVQNDYGISIVSTPKGVMTNRTARAEKVGGEVLCELW